MMLTKIIAACFLLVVCTEAGALRPNPDAVSLGSCGKDALIGDICKKGKGICQPPDNAECEAEAAGCRLRCMTETEPDSKSKGKKKDGDCSKSSSQNSGSKDGKSGNKDDNSNSDSEKTEFPDEADI